MKRPRTARVAVELCKPSTARTWRLLETGILGLATPIHIVEADGTVRQRFYDPFKKRMVCEHPRQLLVLPFGCGVEPIPLNLKPGDLFVGAYNLAHAGGAHNETTM